MILQLQHIAIINGTCFLLGCSRSLNATWKLRSGEAGLIAEQGQRWEIVFKLRTTNGKHMNKKRKKRKVFPGYGNIWAEASPFSFDLPYCIANGRDESIFFSFTLFELKYILNIFSFFPPQDAFSLSINVHGRSICYHFSLFDSRFFPCHCFSVLYGRSRREFKPGVTLLWHPISCDGLILGLTPKPCPVVKGSYLKPVDDSSLHFWALSWLELVSWW